LIFTHPSTPFTLPCSSTGWKQIPRASRKTNGAEEGEEAVVECSISTTLLLIQRFFLLGCCAINQGNERKGRKRKGKKKREKKTYIKFDGGLLYLGSGGSIG
jgi:hypothetical protein